MTEMVAAEDWGPVFGPAVARLRWVARAWAWGAARLAAFAAWLETPERPFIGLLAALATLWLLDAAVEVARDPWALLIIMTCPLAGLLLLRLDQGLPSRRGAVRERLGAFAVFLLMLAAAHVLAALWFRAGGFFGVRETGESASIFLSSHQVRGLESFFLQEVAATSDPAAQGFFYIHHPNFISRLFTMAGIALGLSQEKIILATLMLSATSLLLAFLAFRRLFTPLTAALATAFFATSYGIFVREAGDLLRGLHAVMFWALLYVTALERDAPLERPLGLRLALALLFVLIASSDWAFFVFCLAFYLLWHLYERRGIALRHVVPWVVLPAALTFLAYFAIIIAYTGFHFFAVDALLSYFGRMGNVLSGKLFGEMWDPDKFRALYQAKHIVLWDANAAPAGLHEVAAAYWRAMRGGSALVADLLVAAFVLAGATCLLRIRADRLLRGAVLALFAAACLGAAPFAWMIVVIAFLVLGLPQLGRLRAAAGSAGAAVLYDLAAWLGIVLSADVAVALVFPNYVFWLWDRGTSPVGIADAGAFALIGALLLWGKRPHPVGMLALAALACLHLAANLQQYRSFPPRGPSYAAVLREPRFHGKLFVANTYDALVWYFTRGTSLITTLVPPNRESTERYRHLRDGADQAKYSHPDYFLCDNDPYFSFQREGMINGDLCEMPAHCRCTDFARIMSKAGNPPVAEGPDYAIMKYGPAGLPAGPDSK